MLIALYERAVGLYASLVGINAYHQPGVEAGKKAAAAVLDLQGSARRAARAGEPGRRPRGLGRRAGAPDEAETVFHILERLAANPAAAWRGTRARLRGRPPTGPAEIRPGSARPGPPEGGW